VTFVFDPFSGPNSGLAIDVGPDGALVLNTMLVPTTTGDPIPCTPTETETDTYNASSIDPTDPNTPLSLLHYSAVCAAWSVDSSTHAGLHAGTMLWTADDPANPGTSLGYCPPDPDKTSQCLGVDRSRYGYAGLPDHYRGITFYFTPAGDAWPPDYVGTRFEMGGGSGDQPGIAFRGVLYAPYDDVKISGGNGFDTVGQVLAWTAKFNGGDAYIDLDYPYQPQPAPPYLLEPTLGQ
jgi:hypothetical protein